MNQDSLATLTRDEDGDGMGTAIRLLAREALTISGRVVTAAESIEDTSAGVVLASARSIASAGTRLGTIAGLLMTLSAHRHMPGMAGTEEGPGEAVQLLSFAPFVLDIGNETLTRDGVEVSVQAKQFCILRYLAEHPQRLVRHNELKEAVWGPNVISESLLRTHVRALRKAIGHGVIATVLGRGYRFVPTVARMGRVGAMTWQDDALSMQPSSSFAEPMALASGDR